MAPVWTRTCVEFFAGIGLMRLGLERAGWQVSFAHDISPQKQALYLGHFGAAGDQFTLGDIHTLDAATVPTTTLATASFPCVDLSLAGARQGLAGPQSSAFWGFIRVLDELGARRPPLVLLENVPDWLSSRAGADFTSALHALDRLDYVVDAFIVDAASFVPQSRRRLFIIGTQASLLPGDTDVAPGAIMALTPSVMRPQTLLEAIARNADIRWRLLPLPTPPVYEGRLDDALDDLPDDAPEWKSDAWVAQLLNQMSPAHRAIADRMIAGGRWSVGAVFRRTRADGVRAELRVDGLAGCLRTPGGGSSQQFVFRAGCGRAQARQMTPREAARLMGAGEYHIMGSTTAALRGFGDAVCADVIAWIAAHYLDPLLTELRVGAPTCDKAV